MSGKAGAEPKADADERAAPPLMPGSIVQYVLGADGPGSRRLGEVRPAIVVRVWEGSTEGLVQLQVFLDGANDDPIDGAGLTWRSSVRYSAERDELGAYSPGTWHWPGE